MKGSQIPKKYLDTEPSRREVRIQHARGQWGVDFHRRSQLLADEKRGGLLSHFQKRNKKANQDEEEEE